MAKAKNAMDENNIRDTEVDESKAEEEEAPHCLLHSRAPLRSIVRALHCAQSFARSLAHSLPPDLIGKRFMSMN